MKTILSRSSWRLLFFSGLRRTHLALSKERPMLAFAPVHADEANLPMFAATILFLLLFAGAWFGIWPGDIHAAGGNGHSTKSG